MGNKPNRLLASLVKKISIKGYIPAIKDPSGCRIKANKKINQMFRQYQTILDIQTIIAQIQIHIQILENVILVIIDPDQTGFIKGHQSYCNTRRLFNIICHLDQNFRPGILLAMDAEKAFDSVEWSYMFDVMTRFGIAENFIKWVRLLYTLTKAAVLTNGILSDSFVLHRGDFSGLPLVAFIIRHSDRTLGNLYSKQSKKLQCQYW